MEHFHLYDPLDDPTSFSLDVSHIVSKIKDSTPNFQMIQPGPIHMRCIKRLPWSSFILKKIKKELPR